MFSKFKFSSNKSKQVHSSYIPQLEDYITQRDYTGAITILENREHYMTDPYIQSWIGYCLFHGGDFEGAAKVYRKICENNPKYKNGWINLACCYYHLQMYDECADAVKKSDKSELKQRVQFHLTIKEGVSVPKDLASKLGTEATSQMSTAAMYFAEGRFQEAIDTYKRILEQKPELIALNAYIALCYYKMDYQDVSQQYPKSFLALNLRAANRYKMYGVLDPSEMELISLQELISDYKTQSQHLIRHNIVVFNNGENAVKVLPGLIDSVNEAKLNLAIHYLKNDNITPAAKLTEYIRGTSATELVLKAVVGAYIGQDNNSNEQLKIAYDNFLSVGDSVTDCDTILGRQCMASANFLKKEFSDTILYLNSIKTYFANDDIFNFNMGQAKGMTGAFREAEEAFKKIQDKKLKSSYIYKLWLAYIYIHNGSASLAWDIYLKMEAIDQSITVLQLIANECLRLGIYYYSAKAFHLLERMNSNEEYWEGKRSACLGLFHMVVTKNQPIELLRDLEEILNESLNPQAEYICRVIKKWRQEN